MSTKLIIRRNIEAGGVVTRAEIVKRPVYTSNEILIDDMYHWYIDLV